MRRLHQLLLVASLAAPAALSAQTTLGRDDATFTWSGTVPANGTFTVRSVIGTIEVGEATGSKVEVKAEKRSTDRADIRDIAFEVRTTDEGVTICSTWRERSACDRNQSWSWNGRDNRDASVRFTVLVPRGMKIAATANNGAVTVNAPVGDAEIRSGNGRLRISRTLGRVNASSGNGDVEVSDTRGPVQASSGNGDVIIGSNVGPVRASSGNGRIEARITRMGEGDIELRTGNGSVRLYVPADFDAEVDASTGNGSVETDFPITIQGRVTRSRLRGTIGQGGRTLRMSSGNGRIEIKKN